MTPNSSTPVRNRMFTGLSTLLLVGLALLVGVLVVVPKVLGAEALTVISGSMEPTYKPGDVVVIKATDAQLINAGDVITFQLKSGQPEVATHRVVGVTASSDGTREFTTQGDANNAPDLEPVKEVQIRGKVIYSVPFVGWATTIFSVDIKENLLMAAAVALIVYGLVVLLKPAKKKSKQAAGVLAIAAISSMSLLASPQRAYAAPDMPEQVFALSVDGVSWQRGTLTRFLPETLQLVPGSYHQGMIYVQNTAPRGVTTTLTAQVLSANSKVSETVGFTLSDPSTGEPVDSFQLEPSQVTRLMATVELDPEVQDPDLMAQQMVLRISAHSVLTVPYQEPTKPAPTSDPKDPSDDTTDNGNDDGNTDTTPVEPVAKEPAVQKPGGLAQTGVGFGLLGAMTLAGALVVAGIVTRKRGCNHR